jgi:predicted nucleotidyltransferase component of viral defense system
LTQKNIKNIAASVKQRLLNLSKDMNISLQYILLDYARERFLKRLEVSGYGSHLILKGGFLFCIWSDLHHRATKDLDFLCIDNCDLVFFTEVFRKICKTEIESDGIIFLENTIVENSLEQANKRVIRIELQAKIDTAIIPLKFDIGFEDKVTPVIARLPSLMGFSEPEIKIYPQESLIAEKFEAMVTLDIANSRMKDFFDVWYLAKHYSFDGEKLATAISETFLQRKTLLPKKNPTALTEEFWKIKEKQWNAFLKKEKLTVIDCDFKSVGELIKKFIMEPVSACNNNNPFNRVWNPEELWH